MTVFVRLATEQCFHRLLTVGVDRHVTACLSTIPAGAAVVLSAVDPPPWLSCPGCARDLAAKRQRVPTVNLRPSVREIGCHVELTTETKRR